MAVRDLDLEIGDGEFVVLVGPSGCGKSTTLRMIAGLETIRRRAQIGGRVVNDVPAKRAGYRDGVPELRALSPHDGVRKHGVRPEAPEAAARRRSNGGYGRGRQILGIEPLLDRNAPARCQAASASGSRSAGRIVRKPQVFLFDEPLSNLDAKLRVQMRREIARLHQQLGTTMIYVTHDQVEAMTLGDRIVVMNRAQVQQVDTPAALYQRPRNTFVASFIGTPPMNLIEGRLSEGRFEAEGFGLATRGWPVEHWCAEWTTGRSWSPAGGPAANAGAGRFCDLDRGAG